MPGEHAENSLRFVSRRLRLAFVAHCSSGFECVELNAALWTGDGQGERGNIVLTEVAMRVHGHSAGVFFKNCIPDAVN